MALEIGLILLQLLTTGSAASAQCLKPTNCPICEPWLSKVKQYANYSHLVSKYYPEKKNIRTAVLLPHVSGLPLTCDLFALVLIILMMQNDKCTIG